MTMKFCQVDADAIPRLEQRVNTINETLVKRCEELELKNRDLVNELKNQGKNFDIKIKELKDDNKNLKTELQQKDGQL